MAAPFASIGGIASGLDTAGIVQSLMQLERRPMAALQQRQATYRQANEVWGQITTRLSTLRTATNKLTDPTWLNRLVAVSSSNDAVARVSTSGGALPGSLTFTVDRLASAHQVTIGSTFATADATLGAGAISLTRGDGTELSVSLGDGATLAAAARALDDLDGVSARVLRVADGAYRLIATSTETGAAAAFSVTSGLAALSVGDGEVLTQGEDAFLRLGTLELTRSNNTITDLYDGAEIRLTGTGTVSIDALQDVEEAAAQVKGFVDALNGLLTQLSTASRTSASAGERGPLAGDPLVRELSLKLRGALSQVTSGGGTYGSLSEIGISLTREGRVTLEESKLRDALATDAVSVSALIGKASSASDPRVEVTSAGRPEPGSYQLQLSTAARVAAITGASYSPPTGSPKTFTITTPNGTVDVDIDEGADLTTAIAKINQALQVAEVTTLVAREAAGEVRLEATRAGAGTWFTVDGAADWGLDGTFAGVDAAGTLSRGTDTWAFTASGRSVTMPDEAVRNLSFRLPLDVDGDLGTISVGDGLGSVMDRILRSAEGSGGSIARAREALDGRIRAADTSIEAFEQRLEIRERTIRRQFTAMESAMAQFNSQASWLASQLGSMTQ